MRRSFFCAVFLVMSASSAFAQDPLKCLGGFCLGDTIEDSNSKLGFFTSMWRKSGKVNDQLDNICSNAFQYGHVWSGGYNAIIFDRKIKENTFSIKAIIRTVEVDPKEKYKIREYNYDGIGHWKEIVEEYRRKYGVINEEYASIHYNGRDYKFKALMVGHIDVVGKKFWWREVLLYGREGEGRGDCPSNIPD